MPCREVRLLLALAVLAPLVVLGGHELGLSADALLAAPLVVLLLPLLGGRYVGEEQLARLRAAIAPAPRRRPSVLLGAARRMPGRVVPRGGLLLAFSLSVRPPPAVAAPSPAAL